LQIYIIFGINFDLSVGLIITKCGSALGYGAQCCGSFPHQKQARETVLSLTNGLRGFGKEFEETLSQKGFLKNRSPLNPNLFHPQIYTKGRPALTGRPLFLIFNYL